MDFTVFIEIKLQDNLFESKTICHDVIHVVCNNLHINTYAQKLIEQKTIAKLRS